MCSLLRPHGVRQGRLQPQSVMVPATAELQTLSSSSPNVPSADQS